VDVGGGGRFEAVAAHAGVDEQVEFAGGDAGLGERLATGGGGGGGGARRARPEASLADSGEQFEPAGGQAEPFVAGGEFLLDERGRPRLVGQFDGERANDDAGKTHEFCLFVLWQKNRD